jgi:rod shape determining protein RodA
MQFDKRAWLDRIKRMFAGFDRPLALIVFLLLCVGIVTLYSASLDVPGRVEDQLRNIMLTFVLMWALANVPPTTLMRFAVPLYTFGIALLVAVALFGLTRKGAKRWINVGVVIQPSEILKIATPLMLAWYYQRREGVMRWYDFLVGLLILAVPVGLIAKQPDLGTAVLVFAAGLFVIYFAGLSFKLIVPVLIAGVIAVASIAAFQDKICQPQVQWPLMHDYQKHRICTLLDPTSDPLGKGFHTIQAVIAIGSGGPLGKGWLKGTQAHLEFIPEKHTDFIFAVFSEEFGLGGRHRIAYAVHAADRARAVYRGEWRDAVWTLAGRLVDDGVLHLRVREYRHGERHLAGGRRAVAVHELRRYRTDDVGGGHRPDHERRATEAVDAELAPRSRAHGIDNTTSKRGALHTRSAPFCIQRRNQPPRVYCGFTSF